MIDVIVKIIGGIIGAAGFALIFRINMKHLPFAIINAAVACISYFTFDYIIGDIFFTNLISSFFVAVLAEVFAYLKKAPTTVFLLPGCIPLVPGGSLYYGMTHLINGEYAVGIDYLLKTMLVGISIGCAIIISTLLRYIVVSVRHKIAK